MILFNLFPTKNATFSLILLTKRIRWLEILLTNGMTQKEEGGREGEGEGKADWEISDLILLDIILKINSKE